MLENLLKSMGRNPDQPLSPFQLGANYDPATDTLTYLEKDCGYASTHTPDSNMQFLLDPEDQTKVIGVKINNFSKVFALPLGQP